MAKIIAVSNQKGGVGKTTTSIATAAGLKIKGFKVLAVDLDPQTNMSFGFAAELDGLPSAFDLFMGNVDINSAIQHTESADIISSSLLLSAAEIEFTQNGREFMLKNLLAPIASLYDYIIIDTPPALGFLTINAFTAADYVVIPMQADIFSLQGITQLADTIERITSVTNPQLIIGGILLCRHNDRTILGRRISKTAEMIAEQVGCKVYNSKIRACISVQEAQTNQESLFDYDPESTAAADYLDFVDELVKDCTLVIDN